MYTFFARFGAVAIAVAVLVVSEASLAGPPRSPYGGIWKPTYTGSQERQRQASDYRTRSFRYGVLVQSRRSFSYQPYAALVKAGDRVTIASDGVKLMRGRDVIVALPKGQEVKILRVQGQWLGTSVEVEGLKKSGWVLSSGVVPIAQTPKPSTEAAGANSGKQQRPEASRRSFSYQATPRSYTARSFSPQRSAGRSHSYRGSTTRRSGDYGSPLDYSNPAAFGWGIRSF